MSSIVINGKLYDAQTGAVIHEPPATPAHQKPKIKKNAGLVMDGVVRGPAKSHSPKTHHQSPKTHHPVAKPHHTTHTTHHSQPHKPQRAATLMRTAVSKPVHTHHHQKSVSHPDTRTAQRLARAQAVRKSQHIQHFPANHHTAQRPVPKKHAAVAVVAPPPNHHNQQPSHHQTPVHQPAVVSLSQSEKLVTEAIKNARSHEANQPFTKKPKRRLSHKLGFKRHTVNLAMGGMAVLLLVGFFVYQNIPSLSMRLASSRAGFSAQLPGYQPSGFSQDKVVSYSPGKVTINFHSNSDDRAFQLTQQVSNWNSQALADNYLAQTGKQYQTLESGGKTVYIYDGASATWVNGGVWYQIEGQSSLSSDQILKIVNSI